MTHNHIKGYAIVPIVALLWHIQQLYLSVWPKKEAQENAIKKHGESIVCEEANRICPISYMIVTKAAYRKLKTVKTLNKYTDIKYEGKYIKSYSEY